MTTPALLDALLSAAFDPAATDADRALSLLALADRLEEGQRAEGLRAALRRVSGGTWEQVACGLLLYGRPEPSVVEEVPRWRVTVNRHLSGPTTLLVVSIRAHGMHYHGTVAPPYAAWHGGEWWEIRRGQRARPGLRRGGQPAPAVRRAVLSAARQALARALDSAPPVS